MKIGDKVRIKTGKRGRPPVGEIIGEAECNGKPGFRVTTKHGPEIYSVEELTLVNPA